MSGHATEVTRVLHTIHDTSSNMWSFSSKCQTKTKPKGKTTGTVPSTMETFTRTKGTKDSTRKTFNTEDIQNVLHQMNYEIKFIPHRHPHFVTIMSKTGGKHGYLKFVKGDQNEVSILQYLTGDQSPSNQVTVISMPVTGGWLTSLANCDKQLWSAVLQLIKVIVFMHEHDVVHMNWKPWKHYHSTRRAHLLIIDFSISILVCGPDTMFRGIVGTEYYIILEVHEGQYKPILADLWSCSRMLEELCAGCHPSMDHALLFQICLQGAMFVAHYNVWVQVSVMLMQSLSDSAYACPQGRIIHMCLQS
ncbi:kinase-like protein [Tylopilus felleus]